MDKFYLKIDAECTDEEHIKSDTEAKIACSQFIAVNVLVRFFEQEPALRELFEKSLRILKEQELEDSINLN